MRAEIFHTTTQWDIVGRLRDLLCGLIYPSLSPKLYEIQLLGGVEVETAWRYVKLLQGAISPEKGLKLTVRELGLMGYGAYVQVYYPFSHYTGKSFQEGELDVFFPSIALRDRMVLVPRGVKKILERPPGEGQIFKPLEMGGVEEVDFHDIGSVAAALQRVAEVVKDELLIELRAFRSVHPGEISLVDLARAFGIDLGYIHHYLERDFLERITNKKIYIEFDSQRFSVNGWTRVVLTVRNDSDVALANVALEITGPIKIWPSKIRFDLPAGGSQSVEIAVKPDEPGKFPVEILCLTPEDIMFSDWLRPQHIWLEAD